MAEIEKLFKGFSKLNREQRFQCLLRMGVLTEGDIRYLKAGGVHDSTLADHLIENSIGYFQLPLGVAANFNIDGVDRVIPMAVEETSIIAAASKTARWVRQHGKITTSTKGQNILGQIQIGCVKDFEGLQKILKENREKWMVLANEQVALGMVGRGGGVNDIVLRRVDRHDGQSMAVFHVHFQSL